MRLLSLILRAAIIGYRYVLSPLWPGVCRFEPSCSAYALVAIDRFGPFRGSWMTARRLARCHPWGGCGDDPVPHAAPASPAVAGPRP